EHLMLLDYALVAVGEETVAERLLRQAQKRRPDDFWINFQLADHLTKWLFVPGQSGFGERATIAPAAAEAAGFYRAALALRPRSAIVYNGLGIALHAQGKFADAAAAYRRTFALRPGYVHAHNNLGNALMDQGKFAEAEAALRHAITLRPNY